MIDDAKGIERELILGFRLLNSEIGNDLVFILKGIMTH